MYTHLKLKTEYSLCRSTIKIPDAVKIAKSHGMKALAICDDGNLFGSLEFAKECIYNKIQPIIGVEVVVKYKNLSDKISLFAKNAEGYKNLLLITNKSLCQKDEKGVVVVDEIFTSLSAGLIVTYGGDSIDLINLLNTEFSGNFYLEIARYSSFEADVFKESAILKIATEQNIPIVGVNASYFQSAQLFESEDILKCIGEGRYQTEDDREKFTENHYFKSPSEFADLFSDLPEAIQNSNNFAIRCNFCPKTSKPILPTFAANETEELKLQSFAGLERRLLDGQLIGLASFQKTEYEARLSFELNVISNMGFEGYFLIVSDFIKWSKNNDIPVGPGRGSGAGSLVAFCLYITDLDPLYYGLLFERFLNPERVSMPDFDIDFCQENRHKVIEYVKNRYGEDQVAAIITFGKLQARAVLKDVGRVLQMPYTLVDNICKMVPFNPVDPVTLEKAIAMDPELQRQRSEDDLVSKLIDIALNLEGLNRHSSTHAAGIIIADRPLKEIVPLTKGENDDIPAVGYNMKIAEAAGLVKFDFLGLKTLTVIANAIKFIKLNKNIDIDISKIDMHDKKTFQLLQKGLTRGIFQLDSAVCKDAMYQMKIDKVEDIIALTSLNRPGPMENIPSYIKRKIGTEKLSYPHDLLAIVLGETYGIVIYQEQVMQIAQVLSGYSLGQADLLRRAMGKKIKEEMEAQRKIFVDGAVQNKVPEKKANEIFDLVEKFAGYGFNKSHAAAYSVISYQTAFLKAHYPLEFFIANLNMSINDTDDMNLFIAEAKHMGIAIMLPGINSSYAKFQSGENGSIQYALNAVKGVGIGSSDEIVQVRNSGGNFKDIFDFCKRVGHKVANKKQLESLIKCGAFDLLHKNRKQLLDNIESIVKYASDLSKVDDSSSISLFGAEDVAVQAPKLAETVDFNETEKLFLEFEALGLYLSSHPLESYREQLMKTGVIASDKLTDMVSSKEVKLRMAGVISSVKQRSGKKGRFAFVSLSDSGGMYETAIFNDNIISEKRELLVVGQLVGMAISASSTEDGGYVRLIVNDIYSIEEAMRKSQTQAIFGNAKSKKPETAEVASSHEVTSKESFRIKDFITIQIPADCKKEVLTALSADLKQVICTKNSTRTHKIYLKFSDYTILLPHRYDIFENILPKLQNSCTLKLI